MDEYNHDKRLMKYLRFSFPLLIGALTFGCAGTSSTVTAENDLDYCELQVDKGITALTKSHPQDYSMMPRNIAPDSTDWACRKSCAEEWCSGFWPGVLWYDYENTGREDIRKVADQYTEALRPIVETPVFDHDLGFLIFCSYGNAYRLNHKPEYKQVILAAADSLATLFNPNVGTICSWPRNVELFGGHNTIMDNMINLEMLFWAAKNGGNPYLYDIAVEHAKTTMKNHFRPDYTSYHVAVYNPETGQFIKGCTHQGAADNSMWARGQAWAIYGYTMVYRETKDPVFLDFAQKVTDVYLSRLPKDGIPYWDFDVAQNPPTPRDVSAACVVASALLELSTYVDDEKSKEYLDKADLMLASLRSEQYRSNDKNVSFLMHSTGHHPAGSEIDYSIIYADYYYIEALTRRKRMQKESAENQNLMATRSEYKK